MRNRPEAVQGGFLSAALALALAVAPAAPVFARSAAPATENGEEKAEKKLMPEQQKMKDAKWQDYKKEKDVKGRAEYQKFLSLSSRVEPKTPRATRRL